MAAEAWVPLLPLGNDLALSLERALSALPEPEADEAIAAAEKSVSGEASHAALSAARFALRARGGHQDAEPLGRASAEAFARLGDERSRCFVEVERASLLAADKARLREAEALALSLPTPPADPALASAVHRARGSVARARADLRGSLLDLEQARSLAEASGSAREVVRAGNTLGTTYAALGVAALARESLERARELAELLGHRQSAAIASGQLAVLALDAGKPQLAARHLEAQRSLSVRLGDVHGEARALSLLVEARAAAGEPGLARKAADEARTLYARQPSAWTRMQAVMATLYEAEDSLASADLPRARELLASCEAELRSNAPQLRVARSREAFVRLRLALLETEGSGEGSSEGASEAGSLIERGLSPLRRSPRPTWVERALLLAVEVCRKHRAPELVPELSLRAASLLELRGSASAPALTTLRELAPEAAVARAMALGRDLVLRARMALAPLGPFPAHLIEIESDGSPGSIDRAVLGFESDEPPTDDSSAGVLVQLEGARRALVGCTDGAVADRGEAHARSLAEVASVKRTSETLIVRADPTVGLVLSRR